MSSNIDIVKELNKLKVTISSLEQQVASLHSELNSVKAIALKTQSNITSHWHFVGTDRTDRTFLN